MAQENDWAGLLRLHDLKKTPARVKVLQTLANENLAVSHAQLEAETKDLADRITLYRILKNFEQKGILHKTIDHEGNAKYALCHADCNDNHHRDHHIHFNCTQCGQTRCLDEVTIPKINLPRGYKANAYSFSINGVCRQCNK